MELDNPDKILVVETEDLVPEDIIKTVKRTGFDAEVI